ncbi:multiple sugar transport system substrate-binding protein [Kribbella aluminosa]|uniref:Multiple sugar transport system substrate-binding protein n=1 Tax=Kribbella aluminosa TaxID=416017 RepID=A0ABS4UFW1_9ACTN|nr:extracellular solute-binding protein [Kribbella aluminosa]MBP2350525.1 multiple sugar transport system substrate-binding protein [Kribbella aluminosa]
MKRLLALAAALCLGVVTACGSGGSGESGSDSGSVTMWIYPVVPDQAKHQAFWDQQIADFKKVNPNIDVKVEIFPWPQRDQKLQTAIAAGKGPDVVYLIPDQLPKYAKNLEPADSYLSDQDKADYLDNAKAAVTYDGKMLGAPILTSTRPLVCDRKAFQAIGETSYPKTWDDLLALAPRFKAKGIDATNYFASPDATLNESFYPLLWQAGGDTFSPDGKSVAFDTEAGVKALEFLKRLVDGGYVEKDLLSSIPNLEQTHIAQHKVACTWQQAPADVESFWGKENVVVLPPLTEAKSVGYGTVGSLSILSAAKSKAAAGKWVAFASQPNVAKQYDLAANLFSPRKSTGQLYPNDPVQSAMEKTVTLTTVGTLNAKSRDVMAVLAPEIQATLLGKKSPQDALSSAADQAKGLLGQ